MSDEGWTTSVLFVLYSGNWSCETSETCERAKPGPDVEPGAPNLSVTEAGHLYGYGSKLTPMIGWFKIQDGLKSLVPQTHI